MGYVIALRAWAGEIPCGYADGCLTREQTILVAYHRGRMAPEHGVTGGLMAAVGLSADAADARLKKEGLTSTVVGCDNSPMNVTLAGARALWVFAGSMTNSRHSSCTCTGRQGTAGTQQPCADALAWAPCAGVLECSWGTQLEAPSPTCAVTRAAA